MEWLLCFCTVLLAVADGAPSRLRLSPYRDERPLYTNSWAVEVTGGPEAADRLARKHGLHNLGQVGCSLIRESLPCWLQVAGELSAAAGMKLCIVYGI